MRMMLVTSPEKGHLNPMMGVAGWLRADGHEVGWLCLPEPSPQLAEVDVEVLHAQLPPPPPGGPALVTGGEALARLVRDEPALSAWIRTLLLDLVPAQIEPVRAVVRGYRPDVIALDGMQYAAVIAAHLEGVPYAGVSSALTLLEPQAVQSALLRNVRSLAADRAALFARHGLHPAFRTCEALSPRLNTVFATRALVGDDADVPAATVLVGPSAPRAARGDEVDFPWARLTPGRPLVYVSYGSQISWQPEVFARVLAAAAPLGVQVVLSCGELAARAGWVAELPGEPIVVDYAPQRALLARAAAFVTHGGANSVMEAMSAGVPLLLSPVCNDQPVQAHFVTRAGVGLELDLAAASEAEVRDALARLVAPASPFAARARTVAADYRQHDGAHEAARRIAGLARAVAEVARNLHDEHRFERLWLTGGLTRLRGFGLAVVASLIGAPFKARLCPAGAYPCESSGLDLLTARGLTGGIIADVGQTAIKLSISAPLPPGVEGAGARPLRILRARRLEELPRRFIGDAPVTRAGARAVVESAAPWIASAVLDAVEAAVPREVPPALVLSLPCPVADDLTPGACTYGWEGDASLVPRITAALDYAGAFRRAPAVTALVLNDAELAALSAPPGVRTLAITLGFGPGAALLSA